MLCRCSDGFLRDCFCLVESVFDVIWKCCGGVLDVIGSCFGGVSEVFW